MKYYGKIIDGHAHIMPQNTASFTEPSAWDTLAVIQRGFGYDNFCVLSLEALYPGQNDACFALRDRTGCYVFAGLDRTREDLAGQAESLLARGARGFKMIEGKPDACKILGEPLNSGRSGEFYNRLEGLGAPLLLHAGDPPEFWSAQTAPAFAVENGWVYEGEGFPALKEIRRQVEDIAENFRNLKLVLAHFYFMAGDLDGAASFLDAHPNVSFDICPGTEMYVHFSKEPKLWREFFIDYSRRIIFGTDNYNVETPKDIFDKGEINRMIHHFLQTPDEFGVWDLRVRGIDLAPEVLERIYFKNFCDLTSGGSVLMKKLIFTLMTLAVIMASAAIALAAGEVYTLREAIEGDTEQGPEWSYLSSVDGGEWQELYYTPDWGDNWQYSDTPDGVGIYYSIYLSEGKLMAEAGVRDGVSYAVAARFTAPRDGELVIAPWRHILTTYDGMYEDESGITVKPITDGYINAVIRKNGEELYRAATDGSLVSSAELKTSVVTGDELWFIVEPGEGAEGDALMNDVAVSYGAAPEQPAITLSLPQSYGGDGVYSLHDAYMGDAEQGPDWFYLKRYGAGTWEELNYYPDYGDNWQVSSKPDEDAIYYSLCDWNGVSAQAGYDILEGKPYEIAAAFKAPEGGTLKIAPWRHIMFSSSGMEAGLITYEPYEGNLYSAEIRKNDEVIYSKMLSGGYQESPPLDIFVEAGDMIYFAFNPRELVDVAFETPTLRMDDILVGYEGVTFKPLAELPEVFAQDLPEPSEPAASEEAAPEPAPEEPESAEAGAATEEPASEEAGAEAAQPASGTQGVPLAVIVTVVLVILVIAAVIITRRRK